MRAIISAKYMPLLAEFSAADDDVRFYLQGFCVQPHEESGVYLVATDGHRLVVIHDETARTDATSAIFKPVRIAVAQSKHAALADFDGQYVDLQDEEEKLIIRARAPLLEANFPDWRSLIRDNERTGKPSSLSPDLLASIRKAPFPDRSGKQAIFFTDPDKPSIIRLPQLPEILILVAPQRVESMRDVPEWVKNPSRRMKQGETVGQNALDLPSATDRSDD